MSIPAWLDEEITDELQDFDYWQWRTADHAVEVALEKLAQRVEVLPAETTSSDGHHTYGAAHWVGRADVLALIRGG